jgi:hypothetical protein
MSSKGTASPIPAAAENGAQNSAEAPKQQPAQLPKQVPAHPAEPSNSPVVEEPTLPPMLEAGNGHIDVDVRIPDN